MHHVITLMSGAIVAQLISVFASPIITRLYLPEELGEIASFLAIVTIFGSISTGRYDLAIVLPEKEEKATAIAWVGIFLALIIGGVLTLIFKIFGSKLGPILGIASLNPFWLTFIGFLVFLVGIEQILNRLAIRERKFNILVRAQIGQQSVMSGMRILLGFQKKGSGGLFYSLILGHLVRTCTLLWFERKRFFLNRSFPDFISMRTVAKRYKKFPLVSTWSTLLNTASNQIPVILFASFLSPTAAGFYSLTNRILNLPMTIIGKSFGDAFIERAARAKNNQEELKKLLLYVYKKLLLISSICMSFVTFYGPYLFPLIFGEKWTEAGRYAQWISIWLLFKFTNSPIATLYFIKEKQSEGLLMNLILFISRIGTILIGITLSLDEYRIIIIFSLVGALYFILNSFRILLIGKVSFKNIILNTFLVPGFVYSLQLIVYMMLRYFGVI